jgi:hypothetical protein
MSDTTQTIPGRASLFPMRVDSTDSTESDVQRMLVPAQAAVAELGNAVRGAGEDTRRAYEALRGTLSSIPQLGAEALAGAKRVRADESLPADYRQKLAAEKLADTDIVTGKLYQFALKQLSAVEATLAAAVVPEPTKDWAERSARRSELDTLLSGDPRSLSTRALEVVQSGNQAHIAELLTEYGDIALRSLQPHERKLFKDGAIGTLKHQTGPATPKVQAAREGLLALDKLNIKGQVNAFIQSAQLYTNASRPVPPRSVVDMPPASSVAAQLPSKQSFGRNIGKSK